MKILSNAFYALSGLCFNNKALAAEIVESPVVDIMKFLLNNNSRNPVLVETISSVISNLTFRNDAIKITLGNNGILDSLVNVYNYYGF